jgi:hypothetical protein
MDDISECTLAIVAAVHEGSRFPSSETTTERTQLAERFGVITSILRGRGASPPVHRMPEVGEASNAPATIEVSLIVETLERLERVLSQLPPGDGSS